MKSSAENFSRTFEFDKPFESGAPPQSRSKHDNNEDRTMRVRAFGVRSMIDLPDERTAAVTADLSVLSRPTPFDSDRDCGFRNKRRRSHRFDHR